jgi:hypothetical protein
MCKLWFRRDVVTSVGFVLTEEQKDQDEASYLYRAPVTTTAYNRRSTQRYCMRIGIHNSHRVDSADITYLQGI